VRPTSLDRDHRLWSPSRGRQPVRLVEERLHQPSTLPHDRRPFVERPLTILGQLVCAPWRTLVCRPVGGEQALCLELSQGAIGHPHIDTVGREAELVEPRDQRPAVGLVIADEDEEERLEPATPSTARPDPTTMVVGVMMWVAISIHMPIASSCRLIGASAERPGPADLVRLGALHGGAGSAALQALKSVAGGVLVDVGTCRQREGRVDGLVDRAARVDDGLAGMDELPAKGLPAPIGRGILRRCRSSQSN
jgi:hypothetical protein